MKIDAVRDLLQAGDDDAIALAAPDRATLTYADLRAHVKAMEIALQGYGLRRGDRVAIVLPNGPEMVTAFLSVAGVAGAAPLNPGYRADEFDFYLTDLNARALLIQRAMDSPARDVALKHGIPVIELEVMPERPAGIFTLHRQGQALATREHTASDDVALLLHTSGTTSRPKLVPLTHGNLTASATAITATLSLTRADRALNIMPLFHIHGLVAGVLAPLSAGGSVYCTPGFNALKFFSWLRDAEPTWYTAVPTMHQGILSRAMRSNDVVTRHRLRFIRSCSSALPIPVMAELEHTFGVPVIEAYAMTEAAHQISCNPLPPLSRKPGSVGMAAGPEVAVMDEGGRMLEEGQVGEVVICGANVMRGYENNNKANAEAFQGTWFRTGDQGVLDHDGYLRITGRLKEIINRGGEKISPREVDDVLLAHEAVAQAVTFALPHDKLGEDVAAAVVLKEGHCADEHDLRAFAAARLAEFKVPRKILIVAEIPKGATGKLQRIGLAAKLGLA